MVKKKKSTAVLKKDFNLLSWILFTFLTVASIFVIFSRVAIPGGYRIFSVSSGSMEPKIKTGSIVFDKAEKSGYKADDIITYKISVKDTVTHRVVDIIKQNDYNYYKVKGDANDAPDQELVPDGNVIGKVLFSIPYLGYLVMFIKSLPGLIIFIVIPATIIIYEEMGKIKKELKKLQKEAKKLKKGAQKEEKIDRKSVV